MDIRQQIFGILFTVYWMYEMATGVRVSISDSTITMVKSESKLIQLKLSEKLKEDVTLNFTYYFDGFVLANTEKYKEVVKPLPAVTMTANTTKVIVTLTASHVGRVAIGLSSSDEQLERLSEVYVSVYVVHSSGVLAASQFLGWSYVSAWAINKIPLMYTIIKTKSSTGVSPDMVAFMVSGAYPYTVYKCVMYFSRTMKNEYHARHPQGSSPAKIQEVVAYTNYSVQMTIVAILCYMYREKNYGIHWPTISIICYFVVYVFGLFIAACFGVVSLLDSILSLALVELAVQPMMYLPQVWKNYKRQSTKGFNVLFVWLDMAAALMLLFQLILDAINSSDLDHFRGNLATYLVCLLTVAFAISLLVQHRLYKTDHMRGTYKTLEGDTKK